MVFLYNHQFGYGFWLTEFHMENVLAPTDVIFFYFCAPTVMKTFNNNTTKLIKKLEVLKTLRKQKCSISYIWFLDYCKYRMKGNYELSVHHRSDLINESKSILCYSNCICNMLASDEAYLSKQNNVNNENEVSTNQLTNVNWADTI